MPYSDAQKRASAKYMARHTSTMMLRLKNEDMAVLNETAEIAGESRTALIVRLVKEEHRRLSGAK